MGAGRVGTAIAHILQEKGETIAAMVSRSEASLERASGYVTGAFFSTDLAAAAGKGNVFFLTTPDDVIADVCGGLASTGVLQPGVKVAHMSGMLGLDTLAAAEQEGAGVLSVHPLQTFADVKMAIRKIPGTVFAITTRDQEAERWAEKLVGKLEGEPVILAEKNKPLYHIGAVMASNLMVALEHMAELIYQDIGLEGDKALKALYPLVAGTLDNLRHFGTEKALTGPVARGDIGVVRRHLETLEAEGNQAMLTAYASLSLFALDLARPNLSKARADELEQLLRHYL